MLQDSFSEQPDMPTSLLSFILFTGYLLNRGSNTNCLCFALRSFLIRLLSTSSGSYLPFRTSSPLHSAALLQTPECSYEQSPVVSALSLTRLVIWNQLPVSVHHSTSVSSFKSSLKVPFPSCICPEEVCDALESMLWPGVLLKVTTVMKSSVSCYCIVFD